MATYDVVWSAVISGTTSVSVGTVLVHNTSSGLYEVASSANRASYGRAAGIALRASDTVNPSTEVQVSGIATASITGLAAGSASWARCSTTGVVERVTTPAAGDDLIGWAEADGSVHLMFGVLTSPIVVGASYTIPALAIDWSLANVYTQTLSAGLNTFTFSNARDGQIITVILTGAASTVGWPAVKWTGGSVPTQTASGTDVYTFVKAGSTIYGSVVQNMS